MDPKITKHTHEVDGKEQEYYIISHEVHDPHLDVYWSWDILAFGKRGVTILAVWDSKNVIWINPDAFVFKGALDLVRHVDSQINQPAD